MREILFRGKRKDNGEWVEGHYAVAKDYLTECNVHCIFSSDLTLYPHSEFSDFEEVIPETIGQFTGLTDKNATKIFEGDIVFGKVWSWDRGDTVMVEWDDGSCGFEPFSDSRENCGHCGGGMDPSECEVIGNIHDNPELLEVK